jgi:hypothetical protein
MEKVKVLGVYPVVAQEPVHLIELELVDAGPFDFAHVTQRVLNQSEKNWQVAYDERELAFKDNRRFAFFFHYLDFDLPLETPFGPVNLPQPSSLPEHLKGITYDAP